MSFSTARKSASHSVSLCVCVVVLLHYFVTVLYCCAVVILGCLLFYYCVDILMRFCLCCGVWCGIFVCSVLCVFVSSRGEYSLLGHIQATRPEHLSPLEDSVMTPAVTNPCLLTGKKGRKARQKLAKASGMSIDRVTHHVPNTVATPTASDTQVDQNTRDLEYER